MAGASKHPWLKAQNTKVLQQRLIVLTTAWTFGNGYVPQPWFKQSKSKKALHAGIHAGLAAFAAEPSVQLPVGLQDAIMAENFDFSGCLTKFGLTWERAKAKFAEGCLTRLGLEWTRTRFKLNRERCKTKRKELGWRLANFEKTAKRRSLREVRPLNYKKKRQATREQFFSTEQVGICPDCGKAADVSKFTVDTRNRCRCPQPDCKKQKSLFHWHCSKCSSKGRAIAKGDLRICKSVKRLRNSVSDLHSNLVMYCFYLLPSISKCRKSVSDLRFVVSKAPQVLGGTGLQRWQRC